MPRPGRPPVLSARRRPPRPRPSALAGGEDGPREGGRDLPPRPPARRSPARASPTRPLWPPWIWPSTTSARGAAPQMRRQTDQMLPLFRSDDMYQETLVALLSFPEASGLRQPLLDDLESYIVRTWQEKNPRSLAAPFQPGLGPPIITGRGASPTPSCSPAWSPSTRPAATATCRSPTSSATTWTAPACASSATPRPTARRRTSSPGWARSRAADRDGLVLSGHMDVVPADEEGLAERSVHADGRGGPLGGPRRLRHEGLPRARRQPRGRGSTRSACGRRSPSSSPMTKRSAPSGRSACWRATRPRRVLPRSADHRRAHLAARGARPQGAPQAADHPPRRQRPQRLPAPGRQRHRARRPGHRAPSPPSAATLESGGAAQPRALPGSPLRAAQRRDRPRRLGDQRGPRPLHRRGRGSGRCPGIDLGGADRAGEPAPRRAAAAPFEPDDRAPLRQPAHAARRRRADPPPPLRPGRPERGTPASPSPPTPAGCSGSGMDCAIFGPGTIEVAHKPNEFLPKDEFAARPRAARAERSGHFCEEASMNGLDPRSRSHLDRRRASSPASRSPSARTAASRRSERLGRDADPAADAAAPSCPAS